MAINGPEWESSDASYVPDLAHNSHSFAEG
jgi:hypothetical protein